MIRFHTTVLAIYLAILSVVLAAAVPSALSDSSTIGEGVLVKRDETPRPKGVKCCRDEDMKFHYWHPSTRSDAEKIIAMFNSKPADVHIVPAKSCPDFKRGSIRVAICNDVRPPFYDSESNEHQVTPHYGEMSRYAQQILDGCTLKKQPNAATYKTEDQACGQQFDEAGRWNVIITYVKDIIENPR
ncbi:hypothetical protein HYFRA_00000580 [Hymenoscyphus fraxineus]|uniref:Uncharacterized protein n=1 Tax=Hymenoscyphus fraxineus TaxID=746836 RepID=A0A9N9L1Q5_9HELO|nr:hypothetical protein HYFRA_00000580 [Hymenoscyphus fraxineus]